MHLIIFGFGAVKSDKSNFLIQYVIECSEIAGPGETPQLNVGLQGEAKLCKLF